MNKRHKRCGFDLWVGKMTWRRAWQPTPVFLPGESQGQRSLRGYSPWGRKELDTTEVTEHAQLCLSNHVTRGSRSTPLRSLCSHTSSLETLSLKRSWRG